MLVNGAGEHADLRLIPIRRHLVGVRTRDRRSKPAALCRTARTLADLAGQRAEVHAVDPLPLS